MIENDELRRLPSVDELLVKLSPLEARFPRALIRDEIRRALDATRLAIRAGSGSNGGGIEERVLRGLECLEASSLRHVINATGVILHTNLGRAPLPRAEPVYGYSNLEYDLDTGQRGQRDTHTGALLQQLCGAPAITVNNNAAAIYLALNELACAHEVIVSRGELIEIGDGFRIPDIMQRSGAVLREVGTTNRTRLEDYRGAINDRTRLILRVHPSNFRIEGFTAKPSLAELAALSRERCIPLYEDLGSGCVLDLTRFGVHEPLVRESIAAGVNLISFSGDKLLGGPQAGILAGDPGLVQRLRRNPMYRALRVDKLILRSLETTLRSLLLERWNDLPVIRMLAQTAGEIRERAERLCERIGPRACVIPGDSVLGGGSTPEQSIPTFLLALASENPTDAERRCRAHQPPVIARIQDGRLVFDLRTVFPEEEVALVSAIQALS